MNAIDTNILAYSVDLDAGEKRQRAHELLATLSPEVTVIPWQVMCELGAVLTKFAAKGQPVDPRTVLQAVSARYRVIMPTRNLVEQALLLRQRQQNSYWDGMLITACVSAGVVRLYSEDLQGSGSIDGVEIRNPFA